MLDINKILEQMRKEEEINCPYCGEEYDLDFCDGDGDLVTYWGEDNTREKECYHCGKTFLVTENVRRTFEVAKK